jgi:hypothetical protein
MFTILFVPRAQFAALYGPEKELSKLSERSLGRARGTIYIYTHRSASSAEKAKQC